jgi:hypothetical protein
LIAPAGFDGVVYKFIEKLLDEFASRITGKQR